MVEYESIITNVTAHITIELTYVLIDSTVIFSYKIGTYHIQTDIS